MKPRNSVFTFAACCLLVVCTLAYGQVSGPHVSSEIKHTVSLPVRNMGPFNAAAWARSQMAPVNVTAGLNFAGQGASAGQVYSDAIGAAGPTQYVQLVNLAYTIYDKTTGTKIAGPIAENSLWSTFGGSCQTSNNGDGSVDYDANAGRWVLSHHAIPSGGPYLNCIAVSTTSDATGTFNLYAFQLTNQFPDKPKLGIWPDAYYIGQDLENPANKSFIRSQACGLDRAAMLAGTFAQSICFQGSISLPTFVPTTWIGAMPPPAGAQAYFWQLDQRPNNGRNTLNQFLMHVDFVNPQNATFTGPVAIALPVYLDACANFKPCIPQPGTTQVLSGTGDRITYRIYYRNFADHESVVMAHAVTLGMGTSLHSAIRWYEFRTPLTPAIYQSGTFNPDKNYRWLPAIAMDKIGDIAVGYNISSTTVFPSLRYSGWAITDPLGKLEPEGTIVAGAGSQLPNNAAWSSMNSMTIDPSDDCTFWFTGQYYTTNSISKWSTQIASFKFPACQ